MYLTPIQRPYTYLDICEFKCLQSADNRKTHPDIVAFQDIFKSSFLSPETFPGTVWHTLSSVRQSKINEMYQKILSNKGISRLLQNSLNYQNYSFQSEGLSCLYQADAIFNETLLSFKVTNEIDYQAFVASVIPSLYHIEAGFAADATGLDKFILFGVQHFHPFEIFCVDLSHWSGPGGLASGRHEYKNLLRDLKNTNFTPSSWVVPT
ncbi:hypothetical protein [Lacihabitans soyangensis]|uniref:Uncharacterized protein n=1 Tax=Lacihabitans soyangensis TaxID=869394 RepID=A0AAE3H3I1_9BACT|nr:hypothetical protein [Lacihabitans soyangensis]MCP9764088.1 hypothetical protein [Lacihabitans soyangensis]